MKKIKILALVSQSGSKYHRVVLPLESLDKSKYEVVFLNENFILESILKDIDYLYIHWIQKTHCAYLSVWQQKYGFKIIQDIDDYWVLSSNHYMKDKIDKVKLQLFDQLILVDIVFCSTPFLLEKCKQFNNNCILRENFIPVHKDQFQPEFIPVIDRKINVGISGSISHYDDWLSIKNQLKRITKDKFILDNYNFVIAGYNDSKKESWQTIINMFPNPLVIKGLPANDYIKSYNHIDILLAPLENNNFNKVKSGLKILESSIKSTIVISNELYKEKGFENYLSTEDKSIYQWLLYLADREKLNKLKQDFQQKNLELNKALEQKYNIEQWLT